MNTPLCSVRPLPIRSIFLTFPTPPSLGRYVSHLCHDYQLTFDPLLVRELALPIEVGSLHWPKLTLDPKGASVWLYEKRKIPYFDCAHPSSPISTT